MIDKNAIAIITETLKVLLIKYLRHNMSMKVDVTCSNPAEIDPTDATINIYLYQTLVDPVNRNNELSPRTIRESKDGVKQTRNSVIPVDLHYLISFYGGDGILEPQILLSAVIGLLHRYPRLTAHNLNWVSKAVDPFDKTDNPTFDMPVVLSSSNTSTEEICRLWSALQTPYVLSVTYVANTVLIHCD